MILTCPECSTRFTLSAQLLGADGAQVKCSGCAHVWHQLPDPDELDEVDDIQNLQDVEENDEAGEPEPEEAAVKDVEKEELPVDDIPDSVKPIPRDDDEISSAPDKKEGSSSGGNAKALFSYGAAGGVFVIILVLLLVINAPVQRMMPSTNLLYGVFGISAPIPGEGLIFDQIKAVVHEEQKNITVKGNIINLGMQKKNIPAMKISLRDTNGTVIEHWYMKPPRGQLKGEGSVSFKTVHEGTWDDITEVNVHFVLRAEISEDSAAKTDAKDDGNNHAQPQDGGTHQPAPVKALKSPASASSGHYQESGH